MNIIIEYGPVFLTLSCIFGFFMAWGVGANDVANAMGTSVGSKALTIKQAVCIAACLEFIGAYLAGGSVTETIRSGMIETTNPQLIAHPELLIYGMLASLLASGLWLAVATYFSWPVSTTHSIVGAIVGFALAGLSPEAVNWCNIYSVVISWVISPLISGVFAFIIFMSVQRLILDTDAPLDKAKLYLPFYMFFVGFIIAMVTLTTGLQHIGLFLSFLESSCLAFGFGIIMVLVGFFSFSQAKNSPTDKKQTPFSDVEKLFGIMMIYTACAMAFAHGSNDVANAVGPIAAIASIVGESGKFSTDIQIPSWVLLLGAAGIVLGLATYGYKVMRTIGEHITELTPSRGFAAELSTASTVVFASGTGLPISTTHTLIGAVLGVGLARGIGALNLRVIGAICLSWIFTLPVGALFSAIFFYLIKCSVEASI